jgi:hypothetical protein
MIAPLRRTHRTTWAVLAVCVPAVFLAAVSSHLPTAAEGDDSPARGPATDEEIVGCWGTLPVHLTIVSREAIQTAEGSENRPVSEPPGGQEQPGEELTSDGAQRADDSPTIMRFSDGEEIALKSDEIVRLLPERAGITRIDLLAPPRHPALFAYWVPGIIEPAPGLADGAQQPVEISTHRPTKIDHPKIPASGATLALYSLALNETVGVIHLRPRAIVLRSCR